MDDALPMSEVGDRLGPLVRLTMQTRRRVLITEGGEPAAVLINAEELADLEDALALANYRIREANGTIIGIPQHEARTRLGLSSG